MSAPESVAALAVLEEAEANTYEALSERIRAARAAVAELVAADKEYDDASFALNEAPHDGKASYMNAVHRLLAAQDRRVEALARVGGASTLTPKQSPAVGGDCSHLHLYQRTHAGFVRITAIIAGEDAANAHMRANPGQALLSLVGETVAVLADVADTGVPEADVPAPEPYFTVFCREVDDEGTTWIGGTHAASARDAIIQCRAECAADWDYGEDSVRVIGVAAGDVDILEWDDENDLAQAEEPQAWP